MKHHKIGRQSVVDANSKKWQKKSTDMRLNKIGMSIKAIDPFYHLFIILIHKYNNK